MKKFIGIGALTLAMSTVTWAHSEKSDVVYQGTDSARKVCMSIVEDNVATLKAALRSDKLRNKRLGDNQETYLCNDMALIDFAEDRGSVETANYLAPERRGRVQMEDVAIR